MKAHDLMKEVESALKDLASMTEKARNSADVLIYLDFLSKFHNYSFYNTLSIFFHCPTATYVAGLSLGRSLADMSGKAKVEFHIGTLLQEEI